MDPSSGAAFGRGARPGPKRRVAVVGLGAAGIAATRFLAEAGSSVTGFEQHALGHGQGSSHGASRIIRHAYSDSFYARLMLDAWPLWEDLERSAAEELLVKCGGLTLGPADHPEVLATRSSLEAIGKRAEVLGHREAARRFPALAFQADEVALFQRDAGFLRATSCVLAQARLAREAGATLRDQTRVASGLERGGECIVQLASGEEEAFDALVLAAGPWMSGFVRALPLQVTRQQVAYLRIARGADDFVPARLPVWIDERSHDYGFPSDGVEAGVKVACHSLGPPWDPEDADRELEVDAELLALVARSVRRLPGLAPTIERGLACLYTSTPSEDFVLDLVPGSSRTWLVSGCSGHGFKFSVLLGKMAAQLAIGGAPSQDVSRFAIARHVAGG